MIRYALACNAGHEFEAWFRSSADYDEQAAGGLVECPFCASRLISKQIMAPAIAGTRAKHAQDTSTEPSMMVMMELARQIREHVESRFDYVGDAFAKEARAIHNGESDARPIYGEARPEEVRKLAEDGIAVAPLPMAATPRDKSELN